MEQASNFDENAGRPKRSGRQEDAARGWAWDIVFFDRPMGKGVCVANFAAISTVDVAAASKSPATATARTAGGFARRFSLWGGALLAAGAVSASASACAGDLNGDGVVGPADLAALLASWGTPEGDLDGDGEVGGSDIGMLLAGWGDCQPACTTYVTMDFPGTLVGGAGSELPPVFIFGHVDVAESGEPEGSLNFFLDSALVFVTVAEGITNMVFDDGSVYLPASGPLDQILVDGSIYLVADVLEQFMFDLGSGLSPSFWPVQSRAVLLLAALVETQAFCCNLTASLQVATEFSLAYWGKLGSISLGGALTAQSLDGCQDFDGCSGDGLTPIGQFDMPCESTDPLCEDDVFAGPNAAYDAVLGLWKGQ